MAAADWTPEGLRNGSQEAAQTCRWYSPIFAKDCAMLSRSRGARRRRGEQQLTLSSVVDGFGRDAGRFLRRVKAHAVFSGDEVEAPLRPALHSLRGLQRRLGNSAALAVFSASIRSTMAIPPRCNSPWLRS